MMTSLFKNFANARRKPNRRRQNSATLGQTECYESRVMLSAVSISGPDPSMPGENAAVEVTGTDGSETIEINYAGKAGDQVHIEVFNSEGVKIAEAAYFVDQIVYISVDAQGGHDVVTNNTTIADYIFGGDGDDVLNGGNGSSYIDGGNGLNDIHGNGGNDVLIGGNEVDMIDGGSGSDTIGGNGGNDVIEGGSGNDTIYGGSGNDIISGGGQNDDIYGESGADAIAGDGGNDHIEGGSGNDVLEGGSGNDDLFGQFGNDTLLGGTGLDDLDGGYGDDLLDGGDDNLADNLTGGWGSDTFVQYLDQTFVNFNGMLWPVWLPQDDILDFKASGFKKDTMNYVYS